jgi:hypothetical protein
VHVQPNKHKELLQEVRAAAAHAALVREVHAVSNAAGAGDGDEDVEASPIVAQLKHVEVNDKAQPAIDPNAHVGKVSSCIEFTNLFRRFATAPVACCIVGRRVLLLCVGLGYWQGLRHEGSIYCMLMTWQPCEAAGMRQGFRRVAALGCITAETAGASAEASTCLVARIAIPAQAPAGNDRPHNLCVLLSSPHLLLTSAICHLQSPAAAAHFAVGQGGFPARGCSAAPPAPHPPQPGA